MKNYFELNVVHMEIYTKKATTINLLFSNNMSVQLLSHVWLFPTPWTAAHQASLFITNSQSSPNSCPLSRWCHPTISSSVVPFSSCFQSSQHQALFQWVSSLHQWPRYWSFNFSCSLPMNIQDWFPLGLTGLMFLQSKGLSRLFSSITFQKHHLFGIQPSYGPTLTSIHDYWKSCSYDYMGLCQ